ncbi:hypothetical protein KCV87_29390 [Actinosynnema pretiosum subsp. pretiosum]|uniref:Uncharacterized protein n=1 Tax=Actinosynnema pretiosum subsp. pretiosum TaxID=103721 RepID=A0AA45R3E2_9PSEU|nr:hypothetical protein APASM_5262 [Actinosynnema pretiosum subsp. pretiosum]QUF03480.1 hypothetical protein KCV87_29390 [Actinosynnema pretiosum subsp. pretiosum]
MMWEDDELRAALRAEVDGPDPRPATGLDEVLRRGRRRVLLHRTGAVAATFALVGGAALGIGSLKGIAQPPSPANPALSTVTTAPSTTPDERWPRVELPGEKQTSTSNHYPAPDSWEVSAPARCEGNTNVVWFETSSPQPLYDELVGALRQALLDNAGDLRVGEVTQYALPERQRGYGETYANITDLSDAEGVGSVRLSAGMHRTERLTPTQMADQDLVDVDGCAPPRRITLDNGAVIQYHDASVRQPHDSLVMNLRIYSPTGWRLLLSQRSFGSPDFRDDGNGFRERVGAGRRTLPLDEARFTAIGKSLAEWWR